MRVIKAFKIFEFNPNTSELSVPKNNYGHQIFDNQYETEEEARLKLEEFLSNSYKDRYYMILPVYSSSLFED